MRGVRDTFQRHLLVGGVGLRACFKNIPGGLSTFAAKSSEFEPAAEASADKPAGGAADVVAPQLPISNEHAPSSRLAIRPAALAIPCRPIFKTRSKASRVESS